jgi:hypothetical protein
MATKYLHIPNARKVDEIYQQFPLQDPRKITPIGTFGLKIYNLSTLIAVVGVAVDKTFPFSISHYGYRIWTDVAIVLCQPSKQ